MMVAFLPVNVDFKPATRTVHLKGACKGQNFDVTISKATLSYLIGARTLTKEMPKPRSAGTGTVCSLPLPLH